MEVKPIFPDHRLHDPKRQAELAVYRDLEASVIPGVALYGARPGATGVEMDFALWLESIARFVLEVKGGQYCVDGGGWFLESPGGAMPKNSPLMQAWDNAMALRNFLCERLGRRHKPFVIAAVVFLDMEPDPDIEALADGGQTHVLWDAGDAGDVAGRLANIAAQVGVKFPPGLLDVQRETALLPTGQPEPERPSTPGGAAPNGLTGLLQERGIHIERVEHLHIHLDAGVGADIPA